MEVARQQAHQGTGVKVAPHRSPQPRARRARKVYHAQDSPGGSPEDLENRAEILNQLDDVSREDYANMENMY